MIERFSILFLLLHLVAMPLFSQQPQRPQTPVEPFPYATEEVVFENAAEGASLAGTLTYPLGYEGMKLRKVPVVVMVTGSGIQNRDEEAFGHRPFAVIADWLARNGIASLRYDDRGTGGSKGPLVGLTTENFASDAQAAVEYLRGLKEFGKTGVLGHSEGGTIAIMLAGEKVPDFIVSLAGVATRGVDCIVWQNEALLHQQGAPKEWADNYGKALRRVYAERISRFNRSLLSDIDSVRLRGGAVPDAQHFVQQMCRRDSISLPLNFMLNLALVASKENLWLDWFVAYDPAGTIGKIKCPVMAINGSLDMQVPAQANLGVMRNMLPGNKKNFIKEYPDKNHLFQSCTKENSLQYAKIDETISEDVLEEIAEWIRGL